MKKIVIWYNPYKDCFYYKIVSFHYYLYRPGLVNSYGHLCIFVIDNISKLEFYNRYDRERRRWKCY